MVAHLVRKLENFTLLSDDERSTLFEIASRRTRLLQPRDDVIRQGEQPYCVNLVLEGFACRYKLLPDGRRQILAFFLPGDMCDLYASVLAAMDHSIGALSTLRIAQILPEDLQEISNRSVRLRQALRWNNLVDEAILREWTVNLGQRSGPERVAHLLCEIFVRLQSVGLANGRKCPFPITQAELSDALGISIVHTNRMLQDMRADDLIVLKGRTLEFLNWEAVKQLAGFDPSYLHLDRDGRQLDAVSETVAPPSARQGTA